MQPKYKRVLLKLSGEEVKVNAEISYLPGKSGHADKDMLTTWAKNIGGNKKMIFVNHGDDTVCDDFAAHLSDTLGVTAVAPYNGAEYDLDTLTCLDSGNMQHKKAKSTAAKENVIYEKLLNDKLSANLGYVYENMISQMLVANGKDLFYHTIPYADGKKYYEIDFIITEKHKISPIEVKSSGYKSHKSLDEFCAKFSDRIMNKYVIYTKDYKRENGVDYIPVYMTMFL
mgnify:CR=1 FL=1